MTRLSPAVARTVAVLNFFADHPMRSFTMTDIIRSVKLSRATCHALLAALVEAEYLYRNSDKSYVLGPRLAAIGRIANESFSPLAVARPEMRKLADEFDVVCAVVVREDGVAVTRERAASVSHLGWAIPEGSRVPLRPPYGSVFMAWESPASIEAWLAQSSHPLKPDETARIKTSLQFFRSKGYCFGLRTVHIRDERHARELRMNEELTDYFVTALNPGADYELAFISAPVFMQGHVDLSLVLMGFVHAVPGHEIERMGGCLRSVCDRITHYMAQQPAAAMAV
jgi:DNA-binding IclR family transcriptional regulator